MSDAPGSPSLRREQRQARAEAGPAAAPARRKKSKRAASTSVDQDATGEGSGQFQQGPQPLFPQPPQQAFPQQYPLQPQQFIQPGPQHFQPGMQQMQPGPQHFQQGMQPRPQQFQLGPQQFVQQVPQYGIGFTPQQLQQAAQLLQQQQFTQVLSQQVFQSTQTAYGTPPPSYGSTQFSPIIPQQHFHHQQQHTFYAQPTPPVYGMPHYSLPLDHGSQAGQSSGSTAAGPLQLTSIDHSTGQHAHEEPLEQEAEEAEGAGEYAAGHDEEDAQQQEGGEEPPPRKRAGGRGSQRYDPLLTHSVPGGPEDPSILKGFEAHVVYDIYNNLERPPLKFLIRSTMLEGWRPSQRRKWGPVVENGAFGHISGMLHDVLDIPLMSAFIERWQPETNSFHLPSCEMTVTLHDVYQIMQLKIRGRTMAYNPRLENEGSYQARQDWLVSNACQEFNLTPDDVGYGANTWSEFKRLITTPGHGYDTNDKVQAYLVYLMSAALFPDKTSDKVDLRYVVYLDTPQKLDDTAWGTGVLCHLYRSLGECTRADCRQASFCYTLLQTWIYAHFPCFRPLEKTTWFNPVPYAQRWHHGEGGPTTSLASYRLALDRLTIEQIDFMPYGALDFTDPDLAPSLYHGVLSCLHTTEPYMPDRVSRQFGRVQSIPSPPIIPVRAWRKRKVKGYTVDYDPAEWVWGGKRFSLEELGEETVYPYQCSDDYHEWFARISHRFVTSRASAAVDAAGHSYRVMQPYWNMPPPEQIDDMHDAMVQSMRMLRPFHDPDRDYQ